MAAQAADRVRVRVAALIVLDGRVVLVRHRKDDAAYHLLPGGGVNPGESLAEALRREVREETGLEVSPGSLLFVNDSISPDGTRHVVNLTFRADVASGRPTESPADPRVEAIDLVDPAGLTDLDLRPPYAEQLQAAVAGAFSDGAAYLGRLWLDGP